ncbi:hypothetical protein K469DRAFT_770691 [Zopfia rhizophila CBS 207.26]|uniref:Uncharacterized protein n=1 Tax=Zopfia rhizophila CBS 207.26 TaxID=1314779 RepID=A0A6A6EAK5_9PEZI|nr:hypothetical protein K469DRAFT_770691 [Zopfia rhizophila CBS 207.26]
MPSIHAPSFLASELVTIVEEEFAHHLTRIRRRIKDYNDISTNKCWFEFCDPEETPLPGSLPSKQQLFIAADPEFALEWICRHTALDDLLKALRRLLPESDSTAISPLTPAKSAYSITADSAYFSAEYSPTPCYAIEEETQISTVQWPLRNAKQPTSQCIRAETEVEDANEDMMERTRMRPGEAVSPGKSRAQEQLHGGAAKEHSVELPGERTERSEIVQTIEAVEAGETVGSVEATGMVTVQGASAKLAENWFREGGDSVGAVRKQQESMEEAV